MSIENCNFNEEENEKGSIIPNRKLKSTQMFQSLQEEYIVCMLRSSIYPQEWQKDFWKNLAMEKKKKIESFAIKKNLLHIFNDMGVKFFYENKIIGKMGLPKFYYRNDQHKSWQEYWDIKNYFSCGSKVNVYDESDTFLGIGIIKFLDYENKNVLVQLSDKSIKNYLFTQLSRII